MSEKTLPFTCEQIQRVIETYPTPFYLYDEAGIRRSARAFTRAFAWVDGFKNYFAVKALPNPYILQILQEEGSGADCSSLPELLLAQRAGLSGAQLMFTSNETPAGEFRKAKELDALINLDDLSHLTYLEQRAGLPETLCFRYNPGSLRTGNTIIGKP